MEAALIVDPRGGHCRVWFELDTQGRVSQAFSRNTSLGRARAVAVVDGAVEVDETLGPASEDRTTNIPPPRRVLPDVVAVSLSWVRDA